ncbi:hypothetical protein, partial [Muribaculum sp.]|uniref:hypothetical protein n=1 Tax=Muribaculum sp. TaxID=1918611 RepID=UPI0023BF2480
LRHMSKIVSSYTTLAATFIIKQALNFKKIIKAESFHYIRKHSALYFGSKRRWPNRYSDKVENSS